MKRKTLLALTGASALLVLIAGMRLHHGSWFPIGDSDATRTGAGKLGDREAAGAHRPIPPDREGRMQLAREWYEKLTAARPELQIHYREVPDEKNGLLQLLEAADTIGIVQDFGPNENGTSMSHFIGPPELVGMLSGDSPWDPKLAASWLNGHEEMLARMEEIGLTPDESCRGVDWNHLLTKAGDLSYLGDMMSVKARLASESGDRSSALRSLQALRGLAQHLGQCEAPPMMAVVIAEGMNQRLVKASGWLTGEAASREEVQGWQTVLPAARSADTAAILRGEWNTNAAPYFLPALMGEKLYDGQPVIQDPHPEISAEAWADASAAQIEEAQEIAPRELLARAKNKESSPAVTNLPVNIDASSRDRIGKVLTGSNSIIASVIMSRGRQALEQAAMTASLGSNPGPEPITGEAYRIDRETGTVQMPDNELVRGMDPVKIPVIKETPASPAN